MPSLIEPAAKRQKLEAPARQSVRASRIFAPYRTVGLVSPTHVPFTSIPLGKTTFQITTSVGKSLHTYDLRRGLNLVFVTRPETSAPITASIAWKDRVIAAWGGGKSHRDGGVWVFKRGKKIAELQLPDSLAESVQKLVVFGSWIVGCCSNRIEVWRSASYEHYTTIFPPSAKIGQQDVNLTGTMCTMPTLLNKVFVGKTDGSIELWNISVGKLVYTIAPPSLHSGAVTALAPSTALDLLAIAHADGSLIIHNVRRDQEILKLNTASLSSKRVTSISFRTDGLGAGEDGYTDGVMATASIEDGDVTFWDLNDGGRVMGVLRNAHYPPSKNDAGSFNGITGLEFLVGQPVVVTSGCDNSLKSWIFHEKAQKAIPSILHHRSGHAASITQLSFLPSEADGADAIGKWLLSAGQDRSLWGWSLRRDGQSTEISQGNVQRQARKLGGAIGNGLNLETRATLEDLKAPEITCIACSLNRDGGMNASTGGGSVWANVAQGRTKGGPPDGLPSGWESILTGHKGDKYARTWFWGRKKAGRWAFETKDGTEVKSVAITACGTFALVGSAGGGIDMFNLQSGKHRQQFPAALTPAQARKLKLQSLESQSLNDMNGERPGMLKGFTLGEGRHTRDVTGIMVDSLNQTVFSCSLDGRIKFWDFATGLLRHELDWHPMTAITASRIHRQNDLIALSCDDLSIRVIDCETRKLVRELWGCIGQITDFCFSDDGRWVIAASMDSVVRVWDLPTGHLIDAIRVPGLCTALAFSPTGEFLATAHADSIGVNIWSNRSLFTHVAARQIDEDAIETAKLPTSSGQGGESLLAAAFEADQPDGERLADDSAPSALDQLSTDMTTLSLVPRSRWQTLLHLETIAARNKPIEPPKAQERAPFFLPSLDSAQQSGATQQASEDLTITKAERSRISALQRNSTKSLFTQLLHQARDEHEEFITHLKALSPSKADIEIRSLSPTSSPSELTLFIETLSSRMKQRKDYEMIQAWMSVFLKIHGEIIGQHPDAADALTVWKQVQETESRRLGAVVGYCNGVVSFLRSSR